MVEEVHRHTVHTLVFRSLKRTHDMFVANRKLLPPLDEEAEKIKMKIKAKDQYGDIVAKVDYNKLSRKNEIESKTRDDDIHSDLESDSSNALVPVPEESFTPSTAVVPVQQRKALSLPKPKWHPPWKLYRVISGHLGWVRCVAVEPGNEWFATGSADRVIKVWEMSTGKLKVSLTGHVSSVRGLAISKRHPYLFSCGEDKQVKCWDLEYNKVIRHYHGHLSAVYSLALHPSLDILLTAGRDATARVWDMRTKANVHTLTGHTYTVASVIAQDCEPQVITGSHDCTIRLWDLAAGRSITTLTHHKKSVRSVIFHPTLYMFASASSDNIKQWRCPEGKFVQNLFGHNAIINCLAINGDGVMVSGGDNGTIHCWDWRTGYNFQRLQAPVQPGSMDSESGISAMCFDQSGTRLITAEADKTIKVYREDETATEESHPIVWRPDLLNSSRRY
ncbi:pleiotropic regulator 1 [Planococcus citri]|uniref:pleiotropic regulator 1 n=1 Tax=Planococcus citri TaxID=170843 RepID=UPI0031F73E57